MRDGAIQGAIVATAEQPVHLLAGQVYLGRKAASVRTLLGSCVAVTLWSPLHGVGGMCHFLLPTRQRRGGEPADARFGDEALGWMVESLRRAGLPLQAFEAHLYGGADTLPDNTGHQFNVGERNIEQGWTLIEQHGFTLQGVDVGDHVPRQVSMDLRSGEVLCRRGPPMKKAA
jgi:chemotaxis protein CheD